MLAAITIVCIHYFQAPQAFHLLQFLSAFALICVTLDHYKVK